MAQGRQNTSPKRRQIAAVKEIAALLLTQRVSSITVQMQTSGISHTFTPLTYDADQVGDIVSEMACELEYAPSHAIKLVRSVLWAIAERYTIEGQLSQMMGELNLNLNEEGQHNG